MSTGPAWHETMDRLAVKRWPSLREIRTPPRCGWVDGRKMDLSCMKFPLSKRQGDSGMTIPLSHHQAIRETQVDQYPTLFEYPLWEKAFIGAAQEYLREQCKIIRTALGREVKRKQLVELYRDTNIDLGTKFIAAMMWGYEAPAGGRRAGYGAHRLCEMFTDRVAAIAAIKDVAIGDSAAIKRSYNRLDQALKKCGPNFFTKHFYFLGKSIDPEHFRPIIFDDRVAAGLVKIQVTNAGCLDLVRVSTLRSPEAYIAYINYVSGEANSIGCKPDQVEYYLFSL
jgi:hypothetical protein